MIFKNNMKIVAGAITILMIFSTSLFTPAVSLVDESEDDERNIISTITSGLIYLRDLIRGFIMDTHNRYPIRFPTHWGI